jgi:fructan beta-fructosidase
MKRNLQIQRLLRAMSLLLWTTIFRTLSCAQASPDLLIAGFESETYQNWKVTGDAFGPGPAAGALPGQMAVDGYLGRRLVNSFHQGDKTVGTLTSPTFQIERRYIQFLIGGGKHPGQTCINLHSDGKIVRTATGPNAAAGGSEHLDWEQWDVSGLKGKSAHLEIVDQATGGWGHINIDQIIQTDKRLAGIITNASREFLLQQHYLNLPVKNGAPKRLMTINLNGQPERQFEIELADDKPDWWTFIDVKPFNGRKAIVTADKIKEDSRGLQLIEQSDQIKNGESLYRERSRPQFHFTSRRGWLNDPNGLVYHQGEYHLFYQHNPYGWDWGNMHWGHAVSSDLLHWRELGEALYPDAMGTMFSGSAVVDWNNSAGFQKGEEKPLVLIYTAAGGTSEQSKGQPFTQCIAYSLDRGRTWNKYEKNPVLAHVLASNRDPKVIWDKAQKKWLMALYLDKDEFAIFSSPDLKAWERVCNVTIPGDSECPDFFELALDGNEQQKRWIFYGGKGSYLIGRFDGKQFSALSGPHQLNFGNCFYASQTFSDIPQEDGRRIMIGWGRVALPGMPFNQMMDFPVELTLRTTDDGPRLFTLPVREIMALHGKTHNFNNLALASSHAPLKEITGELFDISADFALNGATEIGMTVRGVPVSYDTRSATLSCLKQKTIMQAIEGRIRLRLLVDRASIEIFGNDGSIYMPNGVLLDEANRSIELFAKGGEARIHSLVIAEIKSVWP